MLYCACKNFERGIIFIDEIEKVKTRAESKLKDSENLIKDLIYRNKKTKKLAKYKNVKDGDDEANMWPLEYAYYKKVRKKCGVGSYMMFYQFSQQKAVTIAKMDSLLHTVKNLNPVDGILYNLEYA